MVKQVLLCGCGNIGFRHLQALSTMTVPAQITVVEPFEGAHPRISDFIASMSANETVQYSLLSDLPVTPQHFDLAVIATNADTRQSAFNSIVETHSVSTMIFEKILFQSIAAIDEVRRDLNSKNILAYVNCGRRGFESYRSLVSEFENAGPTHVTVTGGAFGLASNAVHFLDLIEFLNTSELTNVDLSNLAPDAIESKRAGFYEVFGTMTATLQNGARLSVTCDNSVDMSIDIQVENQKAKISINELSGTQVRDEESLAFEIKHVSGMPYLYEDALVTGDPGLTPYDASARQHRLYLHAMCEYLKLPLQAETVCPIS